MTHRPWIALLTLGVSAACLPAQEDLRTPVLVELFTSEGCSSCPPADRLVAELERTQPVPRAEVVVLSEHVDYWDYLGWKDPFSSAQFSRRQQSYGQRFRLDSVYTPQIVIDGVRESLGSDRANVLHTITQAAREVKLPLAFDITERNGTSIKLDIRLPQTAHARVLIALAEPSAVTNVLRGENSGKTLPHVSVVRSLTDLGPARNGTTSASLPVPAGARDLKVIAWLQDSASGQVLAIASRSL